MAEDLINSIVDRPIVSKQITETTAELQALQKQLVDTANSAITLNNAIGKTSNGKGFASATKEASDSIDKLAKQQEQQRLAEIKLQQAREKAFDDYEKKLSKAASEESARNSKLSKERDTQLAKQIKQRQQQQAADKKAADEAVKNEQQEDAALTKLAISRRAYNVLLQKTRDAVKNAQDIGAAKGTNSIDFKDAQANAEKYQKELNGINNKLGDYKNQVGNYSKGIGDYIGKAFSGIRTLANIIPNFGIGTFFLVAYEGLKLFLDQLSQGKFSIDAFAASAKALNSAFEDGGYKSAVSNVIDLKEQIKLAKEGFIDQELVVKKYNDTIGETTGKVGTLDEVEQKLSKNSKDYIKSMFFKAAAAAALSQGTDDLVKATKNLATAQANLTLTQTDFAQIQKEIAKGGDQAEMYKGLLKMAQNAKKVDEQSVKDKQGIQDKLVNQTANVYDKLTMMATKFANGFVGGGKQDIDTRRLNNATEVNKILLQRQVDALNDEADNEKNSYAKRRAALASSIQIQKQIRGLELNQELSDVTLQADQKAVITEKYNTDIGKLDIEAKKKKRDLDKKEVAENKKRLDDLKKQQADSAKELLDLQNEYEKQLADAKAKGDKAELERLKQILENSKDVFVQAAEQRQQIIEEDKQYSLKSLADQYAKGLISTEKYQKDKARIENQANRDSILVQIAGLNKIIALEEFFGASTTADRKKLSDLTIALSKNETEQILGDAEKQKAAKDAIFQKEKEIADAALNLTQTLVDAGFDKRKNQIQEQIDLLDDQSKAEIDAVNRSIASNTEKAAKIQIIEAQTAAKRMQLQREQKKQDIEKAKFDKAIAITRIIEETAVAILKLPADGGLLGLAAVPLIVALGALQLANVIAQPIPTYKDGTESHKGGWAIFGEAGTEYVKEPGKAGYLTSGATLAPLPAGTQVISNAELMNAMANPNGSGGYISNQLDLSALLQQNERNTTRLEKALQVKQANNYRVGVRDGKKFSEYLKRNLN